MMIDAVALIMPEEEASANEIRHRAAHVRFARYADTQTHLAVDRALGFSRIGRKGPLPCQFAANPFLKSLPPRIPVPHRRPRIAQPVAEDRKRTRLNSSHSCPS